MPTPGYVACDTHVHTLTHSGHGDATIDERMITLAGEGIELPIATDHNVHIDYEAARRAAERAATLHAGGRQRSHDDSRPLQHLSRYRPAARSRTSSKRTWTAIFDEIFATPGVKVAILNHARDLHSGMRPFGPKLFNAAVGENLDGWPMRFNAMEVINSGATQTDPLRLSTTGWRCSIAATASRRSAAATRTMWPATSSARAGPTSAAMTAMRRTSTSMPPSTTFSPGRVLVSYGLLADRPSTANTARAILPSLPAIKSTLTCESWHPRGAKSRACSSTPTVCLRKQSIVRKLTTSSHFPGPRTTFTSSPSLLGRGISSPHWPTAKPYQPTSPDFEPYTLAVSGPIWLDADGDGRWTSPREYAERLFTECQGDPSKLAAELKHYDAPTAAQAAHLLDSPATRSIRTKFSTHTGTRGANTAHRRSNEPTAYLLQADRIARDFARPGI